MGRGVRITPLCVENWGLTTRYTAHLLEINRELAPFFLESRQDFRQPSATGDVWAGDKCSISLCAVSLKIFRGKPLGSPPRLPQDFGRGRPLETSKRAYSSPYSTTTVPLGNGRESHGTDGCHKPVGGG